MATAAYILSYSKQKETGRPRNHAYVRRSGQSKRRRVKIYRVIGESDQTKYQ